MLNRSSLTGTNQILQTPSTDLSKEFLPDGIFTDVVKLSIIYQEIKRALL